MTVSISFQFDDGRIVERDRISSVTVQDYVFNGRLHPESALVVDGTAYELRLVSDIRMAVHRSERNEKDTANIIINGSKIAVSATLPLSFRDVADMAGFKSPLVPSMTVKRRGVEGRIVHPGESVIALDGMVFNVADTSNA